MDCFIYGAYDLLKTLSSLCIQVLLFIDSIVLLMFQCLVYVFFYIKKRCRFHLNLLLILHINKI